MAQLIECIPNISEGRDNAKIAEIAAVIQEHKAVILLNIDTNKAANRTVFTFAGEAADVFLAAGALITKAGELIDMAAHTGEHPRMGAVDVCPFVPISGISTEELMQMTEQFAEKTAEKNGISLYMYEYNAKWPHRKRLEQIRKGEYEGLAAKIATQDWKPDYGCAEFNAKFGAMVTGTRDYLIAYNINLATKNAGVAKKIAEQIRESGKTQIENGERKNIPGIFAGLKAIGWYISDFGCAQVSMNITNMKTAKMHEVFETVKRLAQELGTDTAGSELIGMMPFEALRASGEYYSEGESIDRQIEIAIARLGLNSVKAFEPNEQILEIKAGWMREL